MRCSTSQNATREYSCKDNNSELWMKRCTAGSSKSRIAHLRAKPLPNNSLRHLSRPHVRISGACPGVRSSQVQSQGKKVQLHTIQLTIPYIKKKEKTHRAKQKDGLALVLEL